MVDFGVKDGKFITLREIHHHDVTVKEGYTFDGVTVKVPFRFIFSNRDLLKGVHASCIHDFMCENRRYFDRRIATNYLVNIWRGDGLSDFKAKLVKLFVNIYQYFKGGWAR